MVEKLTKVKGKAKAEEMASLLQEKWDAKHKKGDREPGKAEETKKPDTDQKPKEG